MEIKDKLLNFLKLHPAGQDGTLISAHEIQLTVVYRLLSLWGVLLIVVLIGLFFFWIDLKQQNKFNWFQRWGAIMVAVALVSVYLNNILAANPGMYPGPHSDNILMLYNNFPFACWLITILGTLIWAYGDLLICWLKQYI